MTIRGFFEAQIARISPPWLSRKTGRAIMRALAQPIDVQRVRVADGVRARMPGIGPDDALSYIGADRVIARGPAESASTYASRLVRWWTDHATRGGPYAMLAQLFAFWRASLNVPIDVVFNNGGRYQMDTSGNVVRDVLTWTGRNFDGSTHWARIWIFFYVTTLSEPLVDEFGAPIVDEHGDPITVDLVIGDTLPDDTAESFRVVPRTWNAAHIEQTTVVLLHGVGRLWDYPVPPEGPASWDDWAAEGGTYDSDPPILIDVGF